MSLEHSEMYIFVDAALLKHFSYHKMIAKKKAILHNMYWHQLPYYGVPY